MRALFLDIDGVLNHEPAESYFESEKIELLNHILANTDARLVITSSWRLGATPREMDEALSSQGVLPGRVIGITPCLDDDRGKEICEWLRNWTYRFGIEKIAILDDRDDVGALTRFLVRTDKRRGLQIQEADRIIVSLNAPNDEVFIQSSDSAAFFAGLTVHAEGRPKDPEMTESPERT